MLGGVVNHSVCLKVFSASIVCHFINDIMFLGIVREIGQVQYVRVSIMFHSVGVKLCGILQVWTSTTNCILCDVHYLQ
jgi:hypothetical protein